MLPKRLSHVHSKHHTPTTAIWFVAIFAVILTFGVGLLSGPFNAYVYLGSILTLAIIPVYILTNIAAIRYFRKERRSERSILRHAILPVLGMLLLAIPIYGQVYPAPAAPLVFFPYLVLLFIVIVAVVAVQLGKRRPEVLLRAGVTLAVGDAGDALHTAPEDTPELDEPKARS